MNDLATVINMKHVHVDLKKLHTKFGDLGINILREIQRTKQEHETENLDLKMVISPSKMDGFG